MAAGAITPEDPADYCRQVEAYLCRKNDGHLIRIVGPAFEQVCGWATRGIPLKVACRGIDRYVERYYAKGPRRRPVRVDFCDADVLDAFDEWRRAVGVVAASGELPADETGRGVNEASRRTPSLPAHIEKVVAHLTALRAGATPAMDPAIDAAVRAADALTAQARSARGPARQEIVEQLAGIDRDLLAAARQSLDVATLGEVSSEAGRELAPYRDRMPGVAFQQSHGACMDRLIRDRFRLPIVTFE